MSVLTSLLGPDAPAVVAALDVDEVAYLNVGSVRSDVSRQSWRPLYELVAPPEWQMLADEQCERCGGSGDELVDSMLAFGVPGGMCPIGPCPDCHEGKPVHTISVPCVGCNGSGAQLVTHPNFDAIDCVTECDDGTVSVDVTVRLVQFQGCDPDEWSITPSGPPLSPGDFVAVFRRGF